MGVAITGETGRLSGPHEHPAQAAHDRVSANPHPSRQTAARPEPVSPLAIRGLDVTSSPRFILERPSRLGLAARWAHAIAQGSGSTPRTSSSIIFGSTVSWRLDSIRLRLCAASHARPPTASSRPPDWSHSLQKSPYPESNNLTQSYPFPSKSCDAQQLAQPSSRILRPIRPCERAAFTTVSRTKPIPS